MQPRTSEGHPACLHCGACCQAAPCGFGQSEAAPAIGQAQPCQFLIQAGTLGGEPLWVCGQAEVIGRIPGSQWMPAFGAGCCRTLCNEARGKRAALLAAGERPRWDRPKGEDITEGAPEADTTTGGS